MNNVVKFPFSVSRRAHARKPRASINGTPEERAAKAADNSTTPAGTISPAAVRADARSTEKRDGRKLRCNPLRAKFAPISPAVTIVGEMHTVTRKCGSLSNLHPDVIREWLSELRAGADSARIVASELDKAAEHLTKPGSKAAAAVRPQDGATVNLSEQNESISRTSIAADFGFFSLIQCGDRPAR
jgi:hypothetical protein